ncbi:MAG: NAD(P)/FAD-dependent oxidoreductase [Clostridiales bacterium]|nr:NAD(P)/FAD-dependent oxidoreductase [Clostridiales bacterium]
MIRLSNIKAAYDEDIIKKVKALVPNARRIKIAKRSVDARKKSDVYYVYSIDVEAPDEGKILKRLKNAAPTAEKHYTFPKQGNMTNKPVIIAGAGPAGLMCALLLSQNGYRVILLERGKKVDKRMEDVRRLKEEGVLNTESNVQFGEGGAGTFSDGKLTTGIKDIRIKRVLEEFYRHGAPEEILYDAKPHVGTDRLCTMVKAIREEIIKNGSEVRFESKMSDIIIKNGTVAGVEVNGEYTIETDTLVIAAGHSARDTFEMLYGRGVNMEQKSFSVGARIEHKREMIDKSMYGDFYDKFPPASYKLWTHLKSGRGVYTFCMCPGGEVIASASEEGGVVTNGMSNYARNGENSNSAVLVNVDPPDFKTEHVLGGMYLQREIERRAFDAAGGGYKAPAMRLGDFLGKNTDGEVVTPSYKPGVTFCDIETVLPQYICDALREGIAEFGKKIKGFDSPGAVMTFPETRSSSPVRILRDESGQSNVKGLYPCGEGAGYAGGITSAAVDGIRTAELVAEVLK